MNRIEPSLKATLRRTSSITLLCTLYTKSLNVNARNQMAKVLVTGGAGFVGVPVTLLVAKSHDVLVIDTFRYQQETSTAIESVASLARVDVRDYGALLEVFMSFRPEVVLHLAAIHFIPECNKHPVLAADINITGTENVLRAAEESCSVKRVIVTSSAAVYPISNEALSDESSPDPTDIYGTTKAVNESQAKRFTERSGIASVSVRLFNVFGPGETSPHVIPEIIKQLGSGSNAIQLGNLDPKRSYIHVNDVAAAFSALVTARLPADSLCLNIGHEEEASVQDIIDVIARTTHRRLEVIQDPGRVRKSDRMHLRCDCSRARKFLGWSPTYSLEEGLRELLASAKLIPQ
ncbi:MAG: NAD(P)-dependent oxidoreductase [Pseudomonadota bacterium]